MVNRILLICAFASFSFSGLKAQLFYNNGADIGVTDGAVLYVDGSAENASGLLSNAGETTIRGYFRNGSIATGGNAAGVYIVSGDWENNDQFTADESTVRLNGGNQQITGAQVTNFYDLILENGNSVKTQTIDASVSHFLNLNNCELATGNNKMNLTAPAVAALSRGTGFVSSTGSGRLVRSTNTTATYLFPTGWNDNGTVVYRPLEITPSAATAQTFEARMAYGDATAEGYDIATKAGNVTAVNAKFFHLIKQSGANAAADLSVYYNPATDGNWSSIGRWQGQPQWEDLANVSVNQTTPLFHNKKSGWTDNGSEPHVLINAKEVEVPYNFPNVFNPGSTDPENTTFHIINDLNLVTLQDLKIYNRWGEPVFDSQRDGRADWNGYYQGKLQPMGNYVYAASVKINSTGQVKNAGGNLSLIW